MMFTANLAGSASSHLRPYDSSTKNDPNYFRSSHLNLNEIEQADEETKKRLFGGNSSVDGGGINSLDTNNERLEIDPERLQSLLNERRRQRCMRDYKTWAYLSCVALIVIGAIVLIILVGSGYLNNS